MSNPTCADGTPGYCPTCQCETNYDSVAFGFTCPPCTFGTRTANATKYDEPRVEMAELNSAGQAYQMVTCSTCDARYQCTPWNDYYNATTLEDGLCETCLMCAAEMEHAEVVTVVVVEDV